MTEADLSEADLREGAIAETDARGDLLYRKPETEFGRVIGCEASFANANLERANLSNLLAVRTDFSGAIMRNCTLIRASLKQADFTGANLEGSDLTGADLSKADFSNAVLTDVNMTLTTMMETNLDDVLTDEPVGKPMSELDPPLFDQRQEHIQFVETAGAQGLPADLSGVDLRPVKTMANMNLAAIRACNTTFCGLDLRNTELQGANLENADLRNSNLEGADLRCANLKSARLAGALLRNCNMGPLIIDSTRRLPTQLNNANLQGADLRGANLVHAVLNGADLRAAKLAGAIPRARQCWESGTCRRYTRGQLYCSALMQLFSDSLYNQILMLRFARLRATVWCPRS